MKILTKIYHQKVDCRAELIEIGISEHGTFSSDSIENKVITTRNIAETLLIKWLMA